ncbi:hypothetical protein ACQPYE_27785 [Actinosynnema sp. CA-299493]
MDELGYREPDRRDTQPLFQVLTEREKTNSTAIASDQPFSKAHRFARTCVRQRRNAPSSPGTRRKESTCV